jgi:hypothetical protein
MKGLHAALLICGLLATWSTARAQLAETAPEKGMVYSKSDPAALKYECTRLSAARLRCDFVQLDIYRTPDATADDSLNRALHWLNEKQCAEASRSLEELQKHPPSVQWSGDERNPGRATEALKATLDYCKTHDEEALRGYFKRVEDWNHRQCKLWAHTYTQTFHSVFDAPTGPPRWVAEEGPGSTCKVHRISQFTKAQYFWNYSARYEVLDKGAEDGPSRCDEIKEHEVSYSPGPKPETTWVDCESMQMEEGCYSPNFPCIGGPPVVMY